MTTSLFTEARKTLGFAVDLDHILTFSIYEGSPHDFRLVTKVVSDVTYWPAVGYAIYNDTSYALMALTLPLIFKYAFRRHRPFVGCKETPYRGAGTIYPGADGFSFPSGHTWMASALAFYYLPVWACVVLGLPWVVMVSSTRIMTGSHYLSDVVAGISAGTLQACGIVDPRYEWPLVAASTALWVYTVYKHRWIVAEPPIPCQSPVQQSGLR